MAPRKRKSAKKTRGSKPRGGSPFKVGQRVQVSGYGQGTVIAVEARRAGRYSDLWIRLDEGQNQELGVRYQHELVEPAAR